MRIKKVNKTSTISKRAKILQYPVNRNSHTTRKKPQQQTSTKSIQDLVREIHHKVSFAKNGMTISKALENSRKEDKDRAKRQLKAFYMKSLQQDVFKFIVKSSGLHLKDYYQVDIKFSNLDKLLEQTQEVSTIIKKSHIKTQCNCERFTYWYRYMATQGNYVLGVEEHRYPKIRNKELHGVLCKHQIRVFQALEKPSFVKIFKRYINNKLASKQTRIKEKDRISTLQASYRVEGE